ncbi:phosphoribosylanthranilate isomerase [Jiulongibacter sp. NS-SX5]|uniref:phosphoribosylanthranilate isomerase n=1 Tax=Jiulongibacter sp. NS-SX5 TaxID=3463854 RepID=UPI0040580650
MKFLWKVCGMRDEQNIKEVLKLKPDFMGFIFFNGSKRFVSDLLSIELLKNFPSNTKKVGVFVNQPFEEVLEIAKTYHLDYVQLHGQEDASYCQKVKSAGFGVFKAFGVDPSFDFNELKSFEGIVDYFLFDTKASGGHGGHGISFDWSLLENYRLQTPFLLAGGLDLNNIHEVKELKLPHLKGIDVNSKFEVTPAYKNVEQLAQLKKELELF